MAYELTFYYFDYERPYSAQNSPNMTLSNSLSPWGNVTLKFEDDDTSLDHWDKDRTPAKLLEAVTLHGKHGSYTIPAGTQLALSNASLIMNVLVSGVSHGQANISGLLMKQDGKWVPIDEADGSNGLYIMTGRHSTTHPDYGKPVEWPENAVYSGSIAYNRPPIPILYDKTPDVPCFTVGTEITTPDGERPIETLSTGDLVLTRDHGAQRIRWIGSRRLSHTQLLAAGNLYPVRIKRSALAPDIPRKDLTLSPQHRLLLGSRIVKRLTGDSEVLAAARQLAGWPGIEISPPDDGITYLHLMFDRHEIIKANGCWVESLYFGSQARRGLSLAARQEVFALFPDMMRPDSSPPAPARQFIRGSKLRELSRRSILHERYLFEWESA